MERLIDLHVHSDCSDGTLSPEELVIHAHEHRLYAIALTDHDTIAGIERAEKKAEEYGIELIPGIEFSTNYKGKDVHILGLGIDTANDHFVESLQQFLDSRDLRNEKMIQALNNHGVSISHEQMAEEYPGSVWTRAHFARFLSEHGYVRDIPDAFARYIGDDCPCFIPREKVTPFQAVRLIHEGGGFAVLAHPMLYHMNDADLDLLVKELKKSGLDAIEAIYSANRWMDESNMKRLARKYSLKITGGSDYHGAGKPGIEIGVGRGNLSIPYEIWEDLQRD